MWTLLARKLEGSWEENFETGTFVIRLFVEKKLNLPSKILLTTIFNYFTYIEVVLVNLSNKLFCATAFELIVFCLRS